MQPSKIIFGFTLLLINVVNVRIISTSAEKSLFDDLPLNGAISPSEFARHVEKSTSVAQTQKTNEDPVDLDVNIDVESQSYEDEQSLFDQMPDQGAILPEVSRDLNVSESRSQRSYSAPALLIRSDAAAKGVEFEIEKPTPIAEFNLKEFNQNFLPRVVNSITQEGPHTVFSPIVEHRQSGPGPLVLSHPKPITYPASAFDATPVRSSNNQRQQPQKPSAIIYGLPSPDLVRHPETVRNKDNHRHYIFRANPPNRDNFKNAQSPKFNDHQHSTYGNHNQQHQNQRTEGGYGGGQGQLPSITTTTQEPTRPTLPPATTAPPLQTQTQFPIITPPPGSLSDSPGQGWDYDYTDLDFKPHNQRDKFNHRTGTGSLSLGFGFEPGHSGHRNSYNTPSQQFSPPSEAYGPPAPQPSYGLPLNDPLPPPVPSYGPPPETPVNEPPAPPPNTAITSISYQTIPVQTVHTELVTVPHVTVSSSSTVDGNGQSDAISRPQRPNRPGGYGPPLTRVNAYSDSPKRSASEGIFTDDQIAALLSVARGNPDGEFTDEDAIATFLSSANRGGSANILGGGNILGVSDSFGSGNILTNDFGIPLPRSRPLIRNSPRNNRISNDHLVAALLNQQRVSDGFSQNNRFALQGRRLRGGPVLTADAVDAVSDIIREQRLRGAISDLSGRLRYQNYNAQRANERYKSLFYKGALLLSALTLIPTVASPVAAAVHAGAANSYLPLLPLASGRRKRDVDPIGLDHESPFRNCKWMNNASLSNDTESDGKGNTLGFNSWFNCALNATESLFEANSSETESLFDDLAFKGAIVPQNIREDLKETVSPEEIVKNSECLQKRFCETLVEIQELPDAETVLSLYSTFARDVENNPWVRASMTAAKNKTCITFFCFEDYKTFESRS